MQNHDMIVWYMFYRISTRNDLSVFKMTFSNFWVKIKTNPLFLFSICHKQKNDYILIFNGENHTWIQFRAVNGFNKWEKLFGVFSLLLRTPWSLKKTVICYKYLGFLLASKIDSVIWWKMTKFSRRILNFYRAVPLKIDISWCKTIRDAKPLIPSTIIFCAHESVQMTFVMCTVARATTHFGRFLDTFQSRVCALWDLFSFLWICRALSCAFLLPQNPKNNKMNDDDDSQPFPLSLRQVFHDAVNNANNETKEEEQQVRTSQSAVRAILIFF